MNRDVVAPVHVQPSNIFHVVFQQIDYARLLQHPFWEYKYQII